uniref:Uncharacterized protein n=1 Tax=Setaria digitata TaxID=48799 RepID=A0A915PKK3_9BILA
MLNAYYISSSLWKGDVHWITVDDAVILDCLQISFILERDVLDAFLLFSVHELFTCVPEALRHKYRSLSLYTLNKDNKDYCSRRNDEATVMGGKMSVYKKKMEESDRSYDCGTLTDTALQWRTAY